MTPDDLAAVVAQAFGLDPAASVERGPRGALGRIWRLAIGSRRYAVKHLHSPDPPDEAVIAAEVAFTRSAARSGVRVAAAHASLDGRYAVPYGHGWLRLYDWLDVTAIDPAAAGAPDRLGTLLGRLHVGAPASDRELDGSPPDPWYDVPPPPDAWPPLVDQLAGRLDVIQAITALARPADPTRMRVCHRDLHPENVLMDAHGEFAVVDWDDIGPADPSRELARVVLDWFFDHDVLDADAARAMLDAYRRTGAPGRLDEDAFGLVIASRLNFLRRQLGIAADPGRADDDREWAHREIEESLRILPTPAVVAELTALDRAVR